MQINASELRNDDDWVGEGTILHVIRCGKGRTQFFIPWGVNGSTPPVPMTTVEIYGTLERDGYPPYTGKWHVQPDQPIEVNRGV